MRSVALIVAVLALSPGPSAPAAKAEVIRIAIGDMTFSPPDAVASVGDTIEWVNADFVDHTATADSEQWDVFVEAGKSAQLTLKRAGSVTYYCRFHPAMTGVIRVTERKESGPSR